LVSINFWFLFGPDICMVFKHTCEVVISLRLPLFASFVANIFFFGPSARPSYGSCAGPVECLLWSASFFEGKFAFPNDITLLALWEIPLLLASELTQPPCLANCLRRFGMCIWFPLTRFPGFGELSASRLSLHFGLYF
jgi:hypothetical protein